MAKTTLRIVALTDKGFHWLRGQKALATKLARQAQCPELGRGRKAVLTKRANKIRAMVASIELQLQAA